MDNPITNAKIWLGKYDLSSYHNRVECSGKCAILDGTTFGKSTHVKQPGLKELEVVGGGFWDLSETEARPDKYINELLAVANTPLTIALPGSTTGAAAHLMRVIVAGYRPAAQIGNILRFELTAEANNASGVGHVLDYRAMAAAGTVTSTPFEVGALAAGQTLRATLHVFAFSATSLIVKLQSDNAATFLSPTDRGTFKMITATDADWMSSTSVVTDTWWRISATLTGGAGTATFAVALAVN